MTKKRLEAHPVADLFPMLPDDEMADLAADIAERGLLQPIVLDADGKILDGRNRYKACGIAKVEPAFTTYEGDDPQGYALAVNIARRNMSKGQTAIVVAKAQREPGVKKLSTREAKDMHGISHMRFSQANVIIEHASWLVDEIMLGTKQFDLAYDEAKTAKQDKAKDAKALSDIRTEAPDIADQITEGTITFDQGKTLLSERQADALAAAEVAEIDNLITADRSPNPTFTQRVEAGKITWAEAKTLAAQWKQEYDDAIQRDIERVSTAYAAWSIIENILDEPDHPRTKAVLVALDEHAREWLSNNTKGTTTT